MITDYHIEQSGIRRRKSGVGVRYHHKSDFPGTYEQWTALKTSEGWVHNATRPHWHYEGVEPQCDLLQSLLLYILIPS